MLHGLLPDDVMGVQLYFSYMCDLALYWHSAHDLRLCLWQDMWSGALVPSCSLIHRPYFQICRYTELCSICLKLSIEIGKKKTPD